MEDIVVGRSHMTTIDGLSCFDKGMPCLVECQRFLGVESRKWSFIREFLRAMNGSMSCDDEDYRDLTKACFASSNGRYALVSRRFWTGTKTFSGCLRAV